MTNQKIYGLPYQGSKSSIAPWISDLLPSAHTLVDPFGGGGAVLHVAAVQKKYKRIIYGDKNPLVVEYINDAIKGRFNSAAFSFDWVSREEFEARKNTSGYIRYFWSFSNAGDDYRYGRDKEEAWHELNALVKDKTPSKWLLRNTGTGEVRGESYWQRIVEVRRVLREAGLDDRVLTEFSQLERAQRLYNEITASGVEISTRVADYRDMPYDLLDVTDIIIYCDPPYEGTTQYNGTEGFDSREFYEWCHNTELPVFFSSYGISDKNFMTVGIKSKVCTMSGAIAQKKHMETLYANEAGAEIIRRHEGGNLLSGQFN